MHYKRKKGVAFIDKKSIKVKGISYKSNLEATMATLLHSNSIPFQYEPYSICLSESFNLDICFFERNSNGKGAMKEKKNQKVRSINYTIDFVGDNFFIETKGYANESFSIRWKLFKKWISDHKMDYSKCVIYKPQSKLDCLETVNDIKKRMLNNI